jgi:hypothetical protein
LDPKTRAVNSADRRLIHAVARASLAGIWIYQGVVPKLLQPATSGELDLLRASHMFEGHEETVLPLVALGEIGFGLLLLLLWRQRLVLHVNNAVLVLLLIGAIVGMPALLGRAFNPVTLNGAMVALGVVGVLATRSSDGGSRRSDSG